MNIVTENLGKRFNREWIFKKLDFTFKSGNCYAIVGPNGSGKSTLLQVLWGQVPQSTGAISYFNEAIPVPQESVFQNVSIATPYMELIEEFTLEEMVQFHFKFKKILNSHSVEELIRIMELEHARNKQISNFSSGMRQRLKLGLAFYSATSALFIDEPTTNLDKKSIEWYHANLSIAKANRLVIIASNADHEYPQDAPKINLLSFK